MRQVDFNYILFIFYFMLFFFEIQFDQTKRQLN